MEARSGPAPGLHSALKLGIALLLLFGAMAVKDWLVILPSPPQNDASRFDADRAHQRLARILGDERAHPVDSEASDAVRARLLSEMRSAGLEPRVTDSFACNGNERRRALACARVRNLVATIGPPASTGTPEALLISAHYDSSFAGPGAADAGIGIATMLETASLLRGRTLRRPVIFLFNEGEEVGLIGARAFVERDPQARNVAALINLEARGTNGPATMFETSRPGGAAISWFGRAAGRPVANSLSTDLYGLIPNSTDVAVFEGRGWTILNFAVIGNETRYHSAGDNLAALDRNSLQHMGAQTLALALEHTIRDQPIVEGERLYGDFLGLFLVILPMLVGLILLGLLLAFFLMQIWRRRAFGRPLLAMIIAIAGSAGLGWAGQTIVGLVRAGDWWRGHPWVTELAVYGSAMAACLAALLLISRAEPDRLRAAFWLTFLTAGATIATIAPGGIIYFLFPPLVAAAGMAIERWKAGAERIGAIAACLLLYLSFGPSLAAFEELMNNGPHWMFAPIGAVMLLPAMIELAPLIRRVPRLLAFAAAGDLLIIPWAAAALAPAYSEDRQQLYGIEYVWDADERVGRWAINNDNVPVEGMSRRELLPHSTRLRWTAPAPALAAPAPSIETIGVQQLAAGRRLRIRLHSGGAESLILVAPANAALVGIIAGGASRRFGSGGESERYFFRCTGRSCDGAELDLITSRTDPIEFTLIGTRAGLPEGGGRLVRARPALARPQYAPDSTISIDRVGL